MKPKAERKIAWAQFVMPVRPSSNNMAIPAVLNGVDGITVTREVLDGVVHLVMVGPGYRTEVPWTNVASVGYFE